MPRYLIKILYDGHLFKGWQIQNNQRTVQQEIQLALAKIAKTNVKVYGSGRTDSGVHALGQAAHFDLDFKIKTEALVKALNCLLPKDILISKADLVSKDFSARYDAFKRTYIYKFSLEENPFQRHYVSVIKRKRFNKELFAISLNQFVGQHDFFSFSKFNPDVKSTICNVQDIKYQTNVNSNWEEVIISADRFLHNMVRRIIGTSINIGHEAEDPNKIRDLLYYPTSSNKIIYTAPPQGLYLLEVSYPNVDL